MSILLLGDLRREEFREASASLDAWGAVSRFDAVESAIAALNDGSVAPDLIVVAQAFSGQFSHEAIDRLRRLAPLARLVGLMGSWCEGEMRSGLPWPAVVRSYWHQWPARCRRQLDRLAKGGGGSWTLPPTATEEERLLADVGSASRQGLVLIHATTLAMAEWLSEACRSRGYATVHRRPGAAACVEGARAAIFDGTDFGRDECEALGRLASVLEPAPVVALASFPRVEDHRRIRSAGAAAVVSKPVVVEELFVEIEEKWERGDC